MTIRQGIKKFPGSSAGKESSCNTGDLGSIPGLGRSLGKWKGYPLQYSGLENGVAKSWAQLSNFNFTSSTIHKDSHFSTSSPMLAIFIAFNFFIGV